MVHHSRILMEIKIRQEYKRKYLDNKSFYSIIVQFFKWS
jgi:hypothetical protein